jgi:hypothetical protein
MNYIFILAFIGVILIIIYLTKIMTYNTCPKDKVVYRFIPRTLEDETLLPVPLDDIFGDMFSKPSPWVGSLNIYDKSAGEKLRGNRLNELGYISQA